MSGRARPVVAVVGHVEWLVHARGRLPADRQIGFLDDPLEEPAGGGGVSAAQVAKLGAECRFYTALGEARRREVVERLEAEGVGVLAAERRGPHPFGLSVTAEADPDRTIVIVGDAVFPRRDDPLPWDALADCDACYFTGWDPETLVAARAARALVVTARRLSVLVESGVRADVLVASATDHGEAVDAGALPVAPGAIVLTEGGRGGRIHAGDGTERRYPPAVPPGPSVDSYGCGDSFVAGLTVGLGRGLDLDGAVALGARCGAACLTGRGGLGPQLRCRAGGVPAPPGHPLRRTG
jgi:ribokinase